MDIKNNTAENLTITTINGQIQVRPNEGYVLIKYYLLSFLFKGIYIETKVKFKDMNSFSLRLPTKFLFNAKMSINHSLFYRYLVLPTTVILPWSRMRLRRQLIKVKAILKNKLDSKYGCKEKEVVSTFNSATGQVILTNGSLITKYYPLPYLFKTVTLESEYYLNDLHMATYMKMTKFLFNGNLYFHYGNRFKKLRINYLRILPFSRSMLSKKMDQLMSKYYELKGVTTVNSENRIVTFKHATGVITLTKDYLVTSYYPIPYLFRKNLTTTYIPLKEFKQFIYGRMTGFLFTGRFSFLYGPLLVPYRVGYLRILPSARKQLAARLQQVYKYIDNIIE